MVIQVKGLVAALEAHQSVGLEGWWDTLVGAIVGVEKIDDYQGNKTPFSNDYRKLIKSTFGNSSWVKSLELIDTDVSAGGIASRIGTADGKTYWDKVQAIIANAKWLDNYADIIDDHSTKVASIHKKLMSDWKLRGEESNLEIWKAAIAELNALDDPLDWAGTHSKPGIKGKLVKASGSVKWSLSKPEVGLPKVLPPLTQEQLNFAIKFVVDVSNGGHEMSKAYQRLYQVADYPTVDGESDIDDEMFRLDDAMFYQYKRLTDVESVCDRIYKLAPGYGDHYELAAALVIWVARSTGSTGASLESVGLESWWDTLVDAINGVKNIDDYRGKKTPWSDEYKKLMRGTFANSRWVSKQKLVDGLVAGGGISKRFGCISNSTDYWANVQLAIENSKWIDDYLKVVKKYSDDIRAIHEKLGKGYRESPDLALVRAAIKEIKALEHPIAYIVKHAKPCLHGKIMPDGKSYKIVPQNTKFESKVPALTQSQFEEAVKIIVAIHNETHPLCKQRDAFWDAAQFCDDDDLISELMDENEELGMQYSDLTYWQSVIDDVTPPGDEYEVIQAGLVLWAARSCGSTAASLESFNGATVDLETIARTGHEAVRSLAQSFGDHSHLSWEESPDWVRNSAINGAALHVLNPGLSAEATHEAWLKAKQEEGWSCGPTKDADRKEHPCMVPYSELSTEHRLKDHLFKSVVDAFVACLKERQPDVEIVGLECACGSLEQQYDGSLVNKVLKSSVPV